MSAALAFVKMIVPFAPLAFGLFSRISRAACWPTRNALNAEFRSVSNAMARVGVGDPPCRRCREPGRRCCARQASAPRGLGRRSGTAAPRPPVRWRRTRIGARRASSPGSAGPACPGSWPRRPTRMPLSANSRAQLALMPGPPPTMRATSCTEGWGSLLSSWVMFVLCPGMAGPALAPHLLQRRECDPTGWSLAWRGRAEECR